jgi:thymidylate kinase
MHAAEIVDAAASSRVLVAGSLPPDGRDLDVLVEPSGLDTIAAALEEAGFERLGTSWVRFADSSAYAVDLIPASAAETMMIESAETLPGYRQLARPEPAHALLILARKLERERGRLRDKHAARIREELGRDPDAWGRVSHEPAVDRLRARFEGRARAVPVRRPRRGGIVALSGLDGSGKSTQAAALAAALAGLGWETERVWVPLGSSAALQQIARTGKRLLGRGGSDERLLWNPGGEGGERSRAVGLAAGAWSTAGTLANALAHLRAAVPAAAAGKVVIFDRYVLDTIVHLRFTYGGVAHPAQERLALALSPRPRAAFFLDLAPEAALGRKQDWPFEHLARQAALYRAEHERLGIRRLDASRPPDDLAAEIAREVAHRLGA